VGVIKMVGMGNMRRRTGDESIGNQVSRAVLLTFFCVLFSCVGVIKTSFREGKEREKHSRCSLQTSKTGKQSQDCCLWQ